MAIVSLLASSTVVNNNIYADSSINTVTMATVVPITPDVNLGDNTQSKVQNVITYLIVGLEELTIEKASSSSTGGTTNGTTLGSLSPISGSISSLDTTTESTVKKEKLYTIKNTINHDSETGSEMDRKYLNSTSKVEEIDEQKYITLTFTGSQFMKNHVIYVNGSKVFHMVTAKSGDSISLRFKVSNLSYTIKVGMDVVPMSRYI